MGHVVTTWLVGTHLTSVFVVLTVLLDQRTGHTVQELLRESCRVTSARGVDDLLAAVEVALEAAAENLHVVLLLVLCGHLALVQSFNSQLIDIHTGLVLSLGLPHTLGMLQIFCLVLPGLTKIHDHLGGTGVQRVEIRSMVLVQTLGSEVVNTPKTVHKFRAHFVQLILGGCKPQVLIVRDHLQRISTSRHGIRTTFVS